MPQLLAGAGMGMALPALSGELMPERTRQDVARLLTIRSAGIAVALAALAPLISSNLTSTIDTAREQGTAAVLDAHLPPENKIEIAPDLFGGLNTDDPRGQLQGDRSRSAIRARLRRRATELDRLGDRLDEVVTGSGSIGLPPDLHRHLRPRPARARSCCCGGGSERPPPGRPAATAAVIVA